MSAGPAPARLTAADRLLRRIGLSAAPAPDAAGLSMIHRAFVSSLPYEDIAVQLGEFTPLEPGALVRRVLHGGRGGYCFELNSVLALLLESLGFSVERRQGIVGPRDGHQSGALTNHLALVVDTHDAGPFIAEAGLGEGPLEPLPLQEGPVRAGAFELTITREGAGWWVAQHEFGSFSGYWFSDAPAGLDAFQPHHRRLSTSAESSFVQTLVVQRPYDDRVVTLRARTLSVDGPGRSDRSVLQDEGELAEVLQARFGIDPGALGSERLERLWVRACAQHQAWCGR